MKRMIAFALFACACIAAVLTFSSGGFSSLGPYLIKANPLRIVFETAVALAFAAFLSSIVSGDYSWVDRLWSTAPVAFTWDYAGRSWGDWRTLAAALVFTAWGARLTFNFARKGGYSGMEDYRWPIMRQRMPNLVAWQAFNLFFISSFQVGLLVLMTLPTYALLRAVHDLQAEETLGSWPSSPPPSLCSALRRLRTKSSGTSIGRSDSRPRGDPTPSASRPTSSEASSRRGSSGIPGIRTTSPSWASGGAWGSRRCASRSSLLGSSSARLYSLHYSRGR